MTTEPTTEELAAFNRHGPRGHYYNLIDSLRRAKVLINAGDFITDIAADTLVEQAARLRALEAENAALRGALNIAAQYAEKNRDNPGCNKPNYYRRALTVCSRMCRDALELAKQ